MRMEKKKPAALLPNSLFYVAAGLCKTSDSVFSVCARTHVENEPPEEGIRGQKRANAAAAAAAACLGILAAAHRLYIAVKVVARAEGRRAGVQVENVKEVFFFVHL